MIFFLVTQRNRFTIDKYLFSRWGWAKIKKIQPISYERFLQKKDFYPGVYIFSDIELLNDQERRASLEIYNRLESFQEKVGLINHPIKSKRRYALQQSLHAQGINSFKIFRLNEDISSVRYPVFLRLENDHSGAKSDLIRDEVELKAKIEGLREAGPSLDEYVVCEFCDTSDDEGVFRKYSCFLLDGQVIPRHIFFSRSWEIKSDDLCEDRYYQEELDYLQTNPHEEILRTIFKDAGIDYGRIDYSFLNGKIQVWEINTNPRILSQSTPIHTPRAIIHQTFAMNLTMAWNSLYAKNPGRSINYPGEKPRLYWQWVRSRPNYFKIVKRKFAKKFPRVWATYMQWRYS